MATATSTTTGSACSSPPRNAHPKDGRTTLRSEAGKHVFGRRIAIAQLTVAKVRYTHCVDKLAERAHGVLVGLAASPTAVRAAPHGPYTRAKVRLDRARADPAGLQVDEAAVLDPRTGAGGG